MNLSENEFRCPFDDKDDRYEGDIISFEIERILTEKDENAIIKIFEEFLVIMKKISESDTICAITNSKIPNIIFQFIKNGVNNSYIEILIIKIMIIFFDDKEFISNYSQQILEFTQFCLRLISDTNNYNSLYSLMCIYKIINDFTSRNVEIPKFLDLTLIPSTDSIAAKTKLMSTLTKIMFCYNSLEYDMNILKYLTQIYEPGVDLGSLKSSLIELGERECIDTAFNAMNDSNLFIDKFIPLLDCKNYNYESSIKMHEKERITAQVIDIVIIFLDNLKSEETREGIIKNLPLEELVETLRDTYMAEVALKIMSLLKRLIPTRNYIVDYLIDYKFDFIKFISRFGYNIYSEYLEFMIVYINNLYIPDVLSSVMDPKLIESILNFIEIEDEKITKYVLLFILSYIRFLQRFRLKTNIKDYTETITNVDTTLYNEELSVIKGQILDELCKML